MIMQITETKVKVSDLCKNYSDNGDGGVFGYDEKYLSIRAFSEQIKRRVYERQGHKCPFCVANGVDTEYAFEEMQGDHIIPWSQGGRTVEDNCQMLCQRCNNDKSAQ